MNILKEFIFLNLPLQRDVEKMTPIRKEKLALLLSCGDPPKLMYVPSKPPYFKS